MYRGHRILFLLIFTIIVKDSIAQDQHTNDQLWAISTRIMLSGSSEHSDPTGYIVYSGISIEASVRIKLIKSLALELSARTESREIDREFEGFSKPIPLGSVELIPVNLILQYRLFSQKRFLPFVGAGMNATFCWEKSGRLNSTDLSTGIGIALQLGTDVRLNDKFLINILAGWNMYRTDITEESVTIASLVVDPLSFGFGVTYTF